MDNKKDYATEDVPDTAVWEEPSDDAAAMEEERPAMAIDSFGYDGDDGDLPATSGSNVFCHVRLKRLLLPRPDVRRAEQ